jgi:aspartate/methionine/tyrosine aminotransferase
MFSRRTAWNFDPNRLTRALAEIRAGGVRIIDLTLSNPSNADLIYQRTAILDSLRNEHSLDYDPQPKGLLPARKAVAKYYEQRGETIDADSLFLTSGTSEAYSYLFRVLANPDDEILIPAPSYPLLDFLAELDDVKLVPYCLLYDHGWQIDFHSLEKAVGERTRAIVLVNPNNPTGSYVKTAEREYLNVLCRQRGLALIVDEVFLDYAHDGRYHHTFAMNDDVLTFTLSGLSKISALPQMKLAWIAVSGPENERRQAQQRLEIVADAYLSVGAPVQWATSALLAQKQPIQEQLMRRIRVNLTTLDGELAKQSACARLDVEGGWYVSLRVPAMESDEELAIKLLQEHGVLVHPGHFYDFTGEGYLVLSLIPVESEFREGITRVLCSFNSRLDV